MGRSDGDRPALGSAVFELRVSRGISLDELADRTGHTKTWIREVERGEHIPGRKALSDLADGLDITVSELLTFDRSTARALDEKQ